MKRASESPLPSRPLLQPWPSPAQPPFFPSLPLTFPPPPSPFSLLPTFALSQSCTRSSKNSSNSSLALLPELLASTALNSGSSSTALEKSRHRVLRPMAPSRLRRRDEGGAQQRVNQAYPCLRSPWKRSRLYAPACKRVTRPPGHLCLSKKSLKASLALRSCLQQGHPPPSSPLLVQEVLEGVPGFALLATLLLSLSLPLLALAPLQLTLKLLQMGGGEV